MDEHVAGGWGDRGKRGRKRDPDGPRTSSLSVEECSGLNGVI